MKKILIYIALLITIPALAQNLIYLDGKNFIDNKAQIQLNLVLDNVDTARGFQFRMKLSDNAIVLDRIELVQSGSYIFNYYAPDSFTVNLVLLGVNPRIITPGKRVFAKIYFDVLRRPSADTLRIDLWYPLLVGVEGRQLSVKAKGITIRFKSNPVTPGSPESKLALESTSPDGFKLYQNYPNPFNPQTTIVFKLPDEENVYLAVYDLNGRLVKVLVDDVLSAGVHSVVWDGKDMYGNEVTSGVYIYKIVAGNFVAFKKMLLVR